MRTILTGYQQKYVAKKLDNQKAAHMKGAMKKTSITQKEILAEQNSFHWNTPIKIRNKTNKPKV